jgi:hypothetical protein
MKRLLLVAICVCLMGCSTFGKNAHRSLSISLQTYDLTLETLGNLYTQDLLSDKDVDKILPYAIAYKEAHNNAVTSLLAYEIAQTQELKAESLDAIASASRLLADFLAVTKPCILEGQK